MTAFRAATGIARRNLRTALTTPSLLLPPLIAPLVFFAAFCGGLSVLAGAPGFGFTPGYVAFEFVFVVIQGAVFTGIFSGLTLARDFEAGLARRAFVAVADRRAIVAGYVLTALGRAPVTSAALYLAGLAAGMPAGGLVEMLLLFGLTELLAAVGALWAAGVALRVRSVQGAPMMQMPAFLGMYLAPAFVPLPLLTGWLHGAARVNPFSTYLESGRALVAGQPVRWGQTLAVSLALLAVLGYWSLRGLRRAGAT
jgi:ABC-2 type transport system permease protein